MGESYRLGLGNVLAVVMGDGTRQAIGLILKPNGQIRMPLKSIKEQENRSGERRMIWETFVDTVGIVLKTDTTTTTAH